jgi:catechol 2,3-dioxygenase-like lactoylglutathione lyase family enzyme
MASVVLLRCLDLEETRSFYRDSLGFEVTDTAEGILSARLAERHDDFYGRGSLEGAGRRYRHILFHAHRRRLVFCIGERQGRGELAPAEHVLRSRTERARPFLPSKDFDVSKRFYVPHD